MSERPIADDVSVAAAVLAPDRRFVRDLFRGLAPRYDALLLAYSFGQDLRWKQILLRRVSPHPGARALDLACGTGLLLGRLAVRLGSSQVVGADINRAMLLAATNGRVSRRLVQADAERLPFASNSFDLVTAGYLLKYVALDTFLTEVARVLRPGGRFAAYDFSRPTRTTAAGRLYSIYLHLVLPRIGRALTTLPGPAHELFSFLPRIAESSAWETRIHGSLRRAELGRAKLVPSLGGAVTWVWAEKSVG